MDDVAAGVFVAGEGEQRRGEQKHLDKPAHDTAAGRPPVSADPRARFERG
jgi:hypothetical protein